MAAIASPHRVAGPRCRTAQLPASGLIVIPKLFGQLLRLCTHNFTQLVQVRFGAAGLEATDADRAKRRAIAVVEGGSDAEHTFVVVVVKRIALFACDFQLALEQPSPSARWR